jgi:DNA invertase Pin-like site-specific DNA recombinase
MRKRFIAYFRVSTVKQGQSGLGLEAQHESIRQLALSQGADIIAEYTEIQSGRNNERVELKRALEHCRKVKATLAIARLDRLARNATFLLQLRDSNVEFTAADMPNADRFIVGILALVAERERDLISTRTKDALAAAKRRGTKLGNPNPRNASSQGIRINRAQTEQFDANVLPIIREIQRSGVHVLRAIAGILDARGIKTRRNTKWSPEAIRLMLKRAA